MCHDAWLNRCSIAFEGAAQANLHGHLGGVDVGRCPGIWLELRSEEGEEDEETDESCLSSPNRVYTPKAGMMSSNADEERRKWVDSAKLDAARGQPDFHDSNVKGFKKV